MSSRTLLFIIVSLAIIGGVYLLNSVPADSTGITNYEECAAAGFPILETYPEQCKTLDGRTFVRIVADDVADLIHVQYPATNALIVSPLRISGEARGTWYFEASFPVQLIDANGVVLYEGPMQAGAEWMTEEFVPFTDDIAFAAPTAPTGVLILKKDNPSGLSEHDREVRVPVRFGAATPRQAEFDAEVRLSVGDRIIFSDSLVVSLREINDSRCQPDVQCIWAGSSLRC